tara:strand:+ start:614 stop:919 length:306 start_codon:yes stop_codon:yes gene_type:complete
MQNKLKVQRIKLLGQDYLIKSTSTSDMSQIVKYVEEKMNEVIKSGVDSNSQQLRIAIFTCLEIAGELLLSRDKNKKKINKLEKQSQQIITLIDEKINSIDK